MKKNITIDGLAVMVQKGFEGAKDEMNKRFDLVDKRFDKIEKLLIEEHRRRIEKLENRVDYLENILALPTKK